MHGENIMADYRSKSWLPILTIVIYTLCLSGGLLSQQEESCAGLTCGKFARCSNITRDNEMLPICECNEGYAGDPYIVCKPGSETYGLKCKNDEDCPLDTACFGKKCIDPCVFTCVSSECEVYNHLPVCAEE